MQVARPASPRFGEAPPYFLRGLSPQGRSGQLWAFFRYRVDAFETRAAASTEEMPIVGIDTIEAFSLRRHQVQGIQ